MCSICHEKINTLKYPPSEHCLCHHCLPFNIISQCKSPASYIGVHCKAFGRYVTKLWLNPEYLLKTMNHGSIPQLLLYCCKIYATSFSFRQVLVFFFLGFECPTFNKATDITSDDVPGKPVGNFFPTITFHRKLLIKLMSLMVALLGTLLKNKNKENINSIILLFFHV